MTQETQQPAAADELTPQQQVEQALHAALAAGRSRHRDFDVILPVMDLVAPALFPAGHPPDWSRVSADDFVESLYAVARYASWTESTRQVAFAQAKQTKGIM